MELEKRIYVVVSETIKTPRGKITQPSGRQMAQACHASGLVREQMTQIMTLKDSFAPTTTLILQARDSAEMSHVFFLLTRRRLQPVIFSDDNPEYGPGKFPTAIGVRATKKQIDGILDYLPLWGAK